MQYKFAILLAFFAVRLSCADFITSWGANLDETLRWYNLPKYVYERNSDLFKIHPTYHGNTACYWCGNVDTGEAGYCSKVYTQVRFRTLARLYLQDFVTMDLPIGLAGGSLFGALNGLIGRIYNTQKNMRHWFFKGFPLGAAIGVGIMCWLAPRIRHDATMECHHPKDSPLLRRSQNGNNVFMNQPCWIKPGYYAIQLPKRYIAIPATRRHLIGE